VSLSATDIPEEHLALLLAIDNVYLSGPITGVENWEHIFRQAGEALERRGYKVFNPLHHQDSEAPDIGHAAYRHYMALELPEVTKSDAVVVLDGWQNSPGARLEVHTAVTCGIPVLKYPDLEPENVQIIMGRQVQMEIPDVERFTIPLEIRDERPDSEATARDTWMPGVEQELEALEKRIVTNAVTGGQKETRAARFDLLPWDQLWRVAELYAYGAQKYEDRNWERGYDFSLSVAALMRHMAKFVQGENDDPESGCPHLASVVFHALALMRFVESTQLDLLPRALDDRPVGKQVRAREDVE
jgi:nucleoside 2-deoxyribosyltransferase